MNPRPRLAVVGAGPAGLYAAQHALRSDLIGGVDVFEALPTPYGLVRYGVAADHPKTKLVTRALGRVFDSPQARFFGNVSYAADLSREDLERHYPAVLYATGAPDDHRLGIDGESKSGVIGAADFVSWYSGHPDAAAHRLDGVRRVVIVGAGNVALDVARFLAKDQQAFQTSDLPDAVLTELDNSSVTEVHVLIRGSADRVKFTPVELAELGELTDVDIVVDPDHVTETTERAQLTETSPDTHTNLALFAELAARPLRGRRRTIVFHFLAKPVELLGADHVQAVSIDDGTGVLRTLPAELVIRAIGYRSQPLEGLPFDLQRWVVPNRQGRVVDSSGALLRGHYVAGWLKRGPSGVIGTNKSDAAETIASVLEDLAATTVTTTMPDIVDLLDDREVPFIDWQGWLRLAAFERELGAQRGAMMAKITDRSAMLQICASESPVSSSSVVSGGIR